MAFVIRPKDKEVARETESAFRKLYKLVPEAFRYPLNEVEFLPRGNGVNYIATADKPLLFGYVLCQEAEARSDIGEVSMLEGLGKAGDSVWTCDDLSDPKKPVHNPVTRENLREFPGYRDYTGQGRVLNIGTMDFYLSSENPGERTDSIADLFGFIRNQDYELIEVEIGEEPGMDEREKIILLSQGFELTGIKDKEMGFEVAVWHNPAYSK